MSTAERQMTTTLVQGPALTTPVRWRGSSLWTQVTVLTRRSIRALATDPAEIVLGLIQPILLLFLFTQVFSSMMMTPNFPRGVSYIDYLMPAVLVNNAVQSSMNTGIGLVEDMKNGVVIRLRSLPIRPATLLVARSLADLARATLQLLVILALGMGVLGYSSHGSVYAVLVSILVTLMLGWSLGWVSLALGAWLRKAGPIQSISMVALLPLMFASSAYVPIADLPPWLQVFARLNPLTYAVDATRAVALNTSGAGSILAAFVVAVILTTVGAVAAVLGFRRPL